MPNPYGGIAGIWGNDSMYDYEYVDFGQVAIQWGQVHTAIDTYNWTPLENLIQARIAKGVRFTVQVNGNTKPAFFFNHVPYHPSKLSHQVENSQGTLMYWHPWYKLRQAEFYAAFCAYLEAHPDKEWFIGVRTTFNGLGTEHWMASNVMPPQGEWILPGGSTFYSLGGAEDQGHKDRINGYWLDGLSTIPPFFRNDEPQNYPSNISTRFAAGTASPYQTGSDLQAIYNGTGPKWRYGALIQHGRSGNTKTYCEQYAASDGVYGSSGQNMAHRWCPPNQWTWWRSLFELHIGTTYISVYKADLDRGQSNADFAAAFAFCNKYAGYHAKPTESPGAWIAFRRGYNGEWPGDIDIWDLRYDYTFLCSHTNDVVNFPSMSTEVGGANYGSLGAGVQAPNYVSPSQLGNQTQRYGAWARRLNSGTNVNLTFDAAFINSSGPDRTIKTTYLSSGGGTLTITAFGLSPRVINVGNSNNWVTDTWDAAGGNDNNVVNIAASSGNIVMHMVEIEREEGTEDPGDPGPGTPATFTHVNNGNPITENLYDPTFFATDSTVDTNGILDMWIEDEFGNSEPVAFFNDNENGGRVAFGPLNGLSSGLATVFIEYDNPNYDSDLATGNLWSQFQVTQAAYAGSANLRFGTSQPITITNTADSFGFLSAHADQYVAAVTDDVILARFKGLKLSTDDNEIRVAVGWSTDGNNIIANGVIGSLAITSSPFGSGHTVTEYQYNDPITGELFYAVDLQFTVTANANYRIKCGPGTATTGEVMHLLKAQLWVNPTPAEISRQTTIYRVDTSTPTLEQQEIVRNGDNTISVSAITDIANGTAYLVLTASATTPTAEQIIAGQDHTGSAGLVAVSGEVNGQFIELTTEVFDPTIAVYGHLVQVGSNLNVSDPVSTTQLAAEIGSSAKQIVLTGLRDVDGTLLTGDFQRCYLYYDRDSDIPLVTLSAISVTAGAVTLTESDTTQGSINSLEANKAYWLEAERIVEEVITAVSLGSDTTLTVTGHSLPASGSKVRVEELVGTTELNQRIFFGVYLNANNIRIQDIITRAEINSGAYTAYESGGVVKHTEVFFMTDVVVTEV